MSKKNKKLKKQLVKATNLLQIAMWQNERNTAEIQQNKDAVKVDILKQAIDFRKWLHVNFSENDKVAYYEKYGKDIRETYDYFHRTVFGGEISPLQDLTENLRNWAAGGWHKDIGKEDTENEPKNEKEGTQLNIKIGIYDCENNLIATKEQQEFIESHLK